MARPPTLIAAPPRSLGGELTDLRRRDSWSEWTPRWNHQPRRPPRRQVVVHLAAVVDDGDGLKGDHCRGCVVVALALFDREGGKGRGGVSVERQPRGWDPAELAKRRRGRGSSGRRPRSSRGRGRTLPSFSLMGDTIGVGASMAARGRAAAATRRCEFPRDLESAVRAIAQKRLDGTGTSSRLRSVASCQVAVTLCSPRRVGALLAIRARARGRTHAPSSTSTTCTPAFSPRGSRRRDAGARTPAS